MATFRPNNNFIWYDINGDGRVQKEEITFFVTPGIEDPMPPALRPEYWSYGVSDNELGLYLSTRYNNRSIHYRFPITGWAKAGTPVYSPKAASIIVKSDYNGEAAWIDAKGPVDRGNGMACVLLNQAKNSYKCGSA